MSDFELTADGVTIQTVEEIKDEIAAKLRLDVDPLITTDPDSLDGQDLAIYASQEREVQEVVQGLADAMDPDNAEGNQLDVIGAIRGIPRNPARKSTFKGSRKISVNIAALTLAATTGVVVAVDGDPTARFIILEDADNSLGVTTADVLVEAEAETAGPVHANSGTLTEIVTPVTGLNAVTNPTDPLLGAEVEGDPEYLERQEEELRAAGTSTLNAIRAALLAFETEDGTNPIREAYLLENVTMVTNADGVPAKSFECVIWDGGGDAENADIAGVIFAHKPAGIQASGATTVIVLDSYANGHPIRFTRCTQRPTNISITLEYDSTSYVGDDAIKTLISDAFQGVKPVYAPTQLKVGQRPALEVSFAQYMAIAMIGGGVIRITDFQMSFDSDPLVSWTDLTPGKREIAVTNTSLISIVSTPAA